MAAFRIADELDALFKESPMPLKNTKSMAIFHQRLDELKERVPYDLHAETLRDLATMFYSDSTWTRLAADQITSAMEYALAILRRRIISAPARCFDGEQ
jgi:hypothetical protein